MMMTNDDRHRFSKRRFLGGLAGSAAGALGLSTAFGAEGAKKSAADGFTFAFLTDLHIQPERGAVDGVRQCVQKVNDLDRRPDFVLTGGDLIMDALDVGRERIQAQWKLFDDCFDRLELPVHHTLGNHDVVGWSARAVVQPGEQDYGKKIFAERYGKGGTYRSFDHRGWHFILLDSIGQDAQTRDYKGWIDDDQLSWLKADLEKTGPRTPVILVTHIPFYSIWHQVLKGPKFPLDAKALVGNVFEFRQLFDKHNIQLVLSGHGHVLEKISLGRITYIQGGAVCGMWWKGPVYGNPEGFGVVECRADGSWDYAYQDYGWKVRAS